jgi:hypothetical protein
MMSSIDPLLDARAFGPEAHSCFDDAWQAIAGNFAADEIDTARSKLARIIVDLTSNPEVGPHQRTQVAIRMMREQWQR